MDDSFDQDGPERTSSGAGVKALRERLEQQNREAQGAHNVTPRLGKNAGVLNQTANGKDQVPSARAMPSGPVPVMQRSGPPPQAVGDLAAGNLPAEVERWKKEAEQHKQAAHQLAKVAKSAKQESTDARRLLDEERDKAQRNREESERVIDSLHKQMDELVHSSATVHHRPVSNSPEVSSLVEKLQDANYKQNELMQHLLQKEDEIEELRRSAAQSLSAERESCLLQVQQLQDALEHERQLTKQQERIMLEKVNHDEGSVTVLMEAVSNRDRHIADLQRQLANAKLMSDTKPVPVDVEQMRALETELQQTESLLEVRSAEVDKMREEMENLKSDLNRLLEQRENLQKVEANLRGQLEQAFAAMRSAGVGGSVMADLNRDKTIQELLSLQEELVHELEMMKRDMSTLAAHNKTLESEKERLLRELGEYTSGGGDYNQSHVIAPSQKRRAQRSAAPGAPGGGTNHSSGGASLQALEQEKSARKILEAENLALRNALSQAQQGMQDVPITQTADHIHAVSMGLISPWEGMAQSESQVTSLENEVKELMGMLNSGKAQGKSVQQLEKLEAANLRLKDKVTELTKMLDASNDEKEQLNTTASKLKEKVTELTLMLDSSRDKQKSDEAQKEEVERLQGICEQQSKWILESSRNNRDRLLLVELQAHILNIEKDDEEIHALKKMVEAQRNDATIEGASLSTRELPKMRATSVDADSRSLTSSTDGNKFSSGLFSSNLSAQGEVYSSQGSIQNGDAPAIASPVQRRVQRSAAPGALRTSPPPPRVSGEPGDIRSSADSVPLRESAIDEMLSAFPDNRDIWASGTSASSKYSGSDLAAHNVPEISDDILNYRPPSTSEIRKSKLAAVKIKQTPASYEKPAIAPSEYLRRSQTSATRTSAPSPVNVNSSGSVSTQSMKPSEYLASRGIAHTVKESVRPPLVQGSPLVMQQEADASHSNAITPERMSKFAEYQEMLEQQGTDVWEQGLSNVQLTPDGSIINVRSSQLLPVAEEEEESKDPTQSPRPSTQQLNPMDVYPPELGGTPKKPDTLAQAGSRTEAAADPQMVLPPGWTAHKDPNTNLNYYHHAESGTSSWEVPKGSEKVGAADAFEDCKEAEHQEDDSSELGEDQDDEKEMMI